MNKRFGQIAAIGIMVLFVSAVPAEAGDSDRYRMHRGHGDMMHGGPDIDRIVEHMSRRLELDETQELAIRNIVDAAKPEAEALRQQAQSNRKAIHDLDVSDPDYNVKLQNYASRTGALVAQMTLLHGRVMAEVSTELTDEQRAKLSEARRGLRERFEHHRRLRERSEDSST